MSTFDETKQELGYEGELTQEQEAEVLFYQASHKLVKVEDRAMRAAMVYGPKHVAYLDLQEKVMELRALVLRFSVLAG